MSDLVGNPEDRFSHIAAQIMICAESRQEKLLLSYTKSTKNSRYISSVISLISVFFAIKIV